MNIYHYDGVTGVYLGEGSARPDPMNVDQFLIPANATNVEPPVPAAGYQIVMTNGAWASVLKPDPGGNPVPTEPGISQANIVQAAQSRLDKFAQTRNYDNILSACSYATSTVSRFANEGQYCVMMRDRTWETLYSMLAEYQAGTRPMPTSVADIMNELPALTWSDMT